MSSFDGSEENVQEYEIVLMAVAGLLGIDDSMKVAVAAGADREVTLAELREKGIIKQNKALYFMLIQSVKGKA